MSGMGFGFGLGITPSEGGGAIYDFYADSTRPDDSGDGRSVATAKKTLSALQALLMDGGSYAFVAGSYWREQINIDKAITLGVVGNGAPPIIDGADVISGTWTQPDAANYPNVWSIAVARSTSAGTETLGYWEDDTQVRYATNNTSDLQANGGWRASSLTGTNPTIYIKAAGNPNSDGIVREYSVRKNGINGHEQVGGGTYGDVSTIVGPIELKRFLGHYNALAGGRGTQKRIFARNGNIHNVVTQAALSEDIICSEVEPSSVTPYLFTMYQASGVGYNPVARRVFAYGPGPANNLGIYAHTSDAGPETVTLEQCYVGDLLGISAATGVFRLDGIYIKGAGNVIANQADIRSRYAMHNANAVGVYNDAGPVDTSLKTRVIEDACFYMTRNAIANLSQRNGSLVVRRCIIFAADMAGGNMMTLQAATKIDLTFEHCVIVRQPGGGGYAAAVSLTGASSTIDSHHNIYIGNCSPDGGGGNIDIITTNGAYRKLANAQAAGLETHSVHLGTTLNAAQIRAAFFQGDPANGDFRLKDLSSFGTFGDGTSLNLAGPQNYWDWNARAVQPGAPFAWPVVPQDRAKHRTYIADPAAWDFYPA